MFLRVSDDEANLQAINDGTGDGGVADGEPLLKFAEAMVCGADQDLIEAREALIDAMDEAAMVDAAGVVSNFERMVRIAD